MRWLIAYAAALIVTLALLLVLLTYGIGCDCGREDTGLFCWLCNNQLLCLAFATSPLWITALANLRASRRRHKRELYGDDYYDHQPK
ncbi:MAG: hypothetical protein WBM03_09660 [Steroidobacteraceae bacterium]